MSAGDSVDGYWETVDGVRGFAYPGDLITHITYTPDCTHTTGHYPPGQQRQPPSLF